MNDDPLDAARGLCLGLVIGGTVWALALGIAVAVVKRMT